MMRRRGAAQASDGSTATTAGSGTVAASSTQAGGTVSEAPFREPTSVKKF
jgi:hypothetical protein